MRAIPAVWVFFVQPLPLAQETEHVTAKSRAGVPLVPPVAVARPTQKQRTETEGVPVDFVEHHARVVQHLTVPHRTVAKLGSAEQLS